MKKIALLLLLLIAPSSFRTEKADSPVGADAPDTRPAELVKAMEAVKPLFEPMRPPGPNDWLASFNEPGQTFQEYLDSNPTVPTKERDKIYVLPLGDFTGDQDTVIDITSRYREAFCGLPVKKLPEQKIKRPLRLKDSRLGSYNRHEQIRT